MSTVLHKDLTGADLHIAKLHADTHVAAGTDPLVLAESQVTDLVGDLADKAETTDPRLSDARTPSVHTHPESEVTELVSDLADKATTVHTHVKADITDFPILIPGTGNGDVVGPVSATPGNMATYLDATGKNIGDGGAIPTTLPASDVSAWAKEGTKPAYTPAEIGSPSGSGSSSGSNTGDQTLAGLGAEAVANKSTSVPTDAASDTKYPSVKAVKDYADGLIAGLLNYRGAYDASGNTYPATGGSGTAGAVMKGDMWAISVAGTLGGVAIQIGDVIIAKINTPAQTAANWNTLNTNISYVPEDQANKENTTLDTSTTKYPTNALVKTGLDGKASKVISATDKVLGRVTAGAGDVEEIPCTAAARSILDDTTVAAILATLGALPLAGGTMTGTIVSGATTFLKQALDADGSIVSVYHTDGVTRKWQLDTVTHGFNLYMEDAGAYVFNVSRLGNVSIGIDNGNANAVLDVVSTTKAFMPPRMTTTQRDAITSPTEGMVIYNLTTHVLNFHNGTVWGAV